MMGVLSDGASDGVDKSLGFAQALTKKSFQSLLADRDVSLVFYFMLVLPPVEQSNIFQKTNRKWNLV